MFLGRPKLKCCRFSLVEHTDRQHGFSDSPPIVSSALDAYKSWRAGGGERGRGDGARSEQTHYPCSAAATHSWLTATVEPFLPTPPVTITVNSPTEDMIAQTVVAITIRYHGSTRSKYPTWTTQTDTFFNHITVIVSCKSNQYYRQIVGHVRHCNIPAFDVFFNKLAGLLIS